MKSAKLKPGLMGVRDKLPSAARAQIETFIYEELVHSGFDWQGKPRYLYVDLLDDTRALGDVGSWFSLHLRDCWEAAIRRLNQTHPLTLTPDGAKRCPSSNVPPQTKT